jgi:hypothetical protein
MEPIYKPLSKEEKEKLEKKGYKEWEYYYFPEWADPDSFKCKLINKDHLVSFVLLVGSFIGRDYCRKYHQPSGMFSLNLIALPYFYCMSFKIKHVDKGLGTYTRR